MREEESEVHGEEHGTDGHVDGGAGEAANWGGGGEERWALGLLWGLLLGHF